MITAFYFMPVEPTASQRYRPMWADVPQGKYFAAAAAG
jgi:hypothetical protein